MAKEDDQLNLMFEIDDNVDDVIDKMQDMEDHVDTLDEKFQDFAKKGPKDSMKAMSEMEGSLFELNKSVNNLQKNYALTDRLKESAVSTKDLMAAFGEMGDMQEELEELTNQRIEANTEAEKEAIDEVISKRKEQYQKAKKLFNKKSKMVTETLKEEQKEMKRVFQDLDKEADETFDNMKSGAGGVFSGIASSLAGGNIGGALEGGGGFFDQALAGAGQKAQALGEKKGVKMKGAGMAKRGGMVQGLGKFAGAVGKFAAAVGPIAAIAGLIMKANSQTQELNKAFTDTTPLIRMSADGLGAAEEHLSELREAATDFATNVRLGLDPQEHMQIIAQLHEHNIMIDELAQSYGSYGAAAREAVDTIRIAQLNLGASTQEVGQFLGDMMDVHARSFERSQLALTNIVAEAEEAGISSKQFFSTVSQLTGQMGLYNFKLESSVHLLSELNKVMDAENAAEFTKQLTNGLKQANAQERIRLMVLNEESKVREMVTNNAKEMMKNMKEMGAVKRIAKDMGLSVENFGETLANLGSGKRNELVARVQNVLGEEASRQLSMMSNQFEAAEEGGFKLADAMSDLGAMQTLELKTGSLESVFKKPIEEITSIEAEAMNVSQDQLRQMQRFSEVSRGNLQILKTMSKQEDMTSEKFSKMAEEMGINAKLNEKTGEILSEQGNVIDDQYDVMKATKDDRKDEIKKQAEEQKSAAEMQVEKTQNVADILQYVIADLLNELGVVTSEINSILYKHLSGASSEEISSREMRSERMRMQSKIRDMQNKGDLSAEEKETLKTMKAEAEAMEGLETALSEGDIHGETSTMMRKNAMKKLRMMKETGALGKVDIEDVVQATSMKNLKKEAKMKGYKETPAWEKTLQMMTPGGAVSGTIQSMESGKAVRDVSKKRIKGLAESSNAKRAIKEQEDIKAEALENLGEEAGNQKKATEEVKRVLKDRGIQVQKKAAKKIAQEIVAEQAKQKIAKELMQAGFSAKNAKTMANVIHGGAGTKAAKKAASGLMGEGNSPSAKMNKIIDQLTSPITGPKPAKDARMVTGGIPFLNLAKGDIIVDENSLAQTLRGGKGSMVPDLMKKAGMSGRTGQGINQNVNIVINGGDTSKVRQTVLKTLDYINRKKGGK